MGLQSTIQNLVGTAFTGVGDLAKTVSYQHEGLEADYDTTTGDVTEDSESATVNVRAVIANPSGGDIQKILPSALVEIARIGDLLLLIPNGDLVTEPRSGDRIVMDDATWVVKGFVTDPAQGMWKVLVNRVGGGAEGQLVYHS